LAAFLVPFRADFRAPRLADFLAARLADFFAPRLAPRLAPRFALFPALFFVRRRVLFPGARPADVEGAVDALEEG
jgi:hypothetical protein